MAAMFSFHRGHYADKASSAISDSVLQSALTEFQNLLGKGGARAIANLPEGRALRQTGRSIREKAITNLDVLLEVLATTIQKNGGKVYFAQDSTEAIDQCLKIARRHDVKLAVKGKSMVTEEIGLNRALERAGIEAVETDLGEYIIQLAQEHPSHIIAPAIHKTRDQIGALFARKLNIPYTNNPSVLTRAARKALREKFLKADMGISGCNLACAQTGHITTVSNEGNIRMATTLPKVHVAFMGMERVAATLDDLQVLIRLLTRAAAAQNMAGYISFIGGPAAPGHPDGPEEFHLIIIDNGRTKILADKTFREILYCIRCAACLNVCPVYGKIGGHAYGSPYCGPVGAVVTPLLFGIEAAKDLCCGETLCGACKAMCPVDIDIVRMLLALRAKLAEGDQAWKVVPDNRIERAVYTLWSIIIRDRRLYDFVLGTGRRLQHLLPRKDGMITHLVGPLKGWSEERDLRPLAKASFIQQVKNSRKAG
jgi:L-lactate dehydrogenase complex protein LldF